jgi:hypothetical protein
MKMKYIEEFNFWLPLIGLGIFGAIAVGAWFADQKIIGVWAGFIGIVCVLLLLALRLNDSIRESSKEKTLSPEAAALAILAKTQAASQRARVFIRPQLVGPISQGVSINFVLVAENVGNESATGVNHHGITMMFDMPKQIGYAPEIWSPQFKEVIDPESDLATPVRGKATIFPGQNLALQGGWYNAEDIGALISGKKILVTYGCLGYLVEEKPHYTWYCFYLMRNKETGDWSFGNAPIGNDAT